MNAIESAFTEMARAQARTADSIVQLTSSAAALVQHAGIMHALPPAPPPASPPQTFAAIAGAPAPAGEAAVASASGAAMDVTAAGAVASVEAPAAGALVARPDDASEHGRVGARGRVPERGDGLERRQHAGAGRGPGVPPHAPLAGNGLSAVVRAWHGTRHGRGTARLGGSRPGVFASRTKPSGTTSTTRTLTTSATSPSTCSSATRTTTTVPLLMTTTRRSTTAKAVATTRLASTALFPRRCIFAAGPRSPERVGA